MAATAAYFGEVIDAPGLWPAVIPTVTTVVLFCAGVRLLLWAIVESGELAQWVIGALWIAGAAAFSDPVLALVGWRWPSSSLALALAYSLAVPVIVVELKHRRGFGVRLLYAVAWPWLDLLPIPDVVFQANGILGTAALLACVAESLHRYYPRKESP